MLALAPRWPGLIDVADGDAALMRIRDSESPSFHVVLCDLHLPGASGDIIQPAALERDPDTAFLLMTAHASVDSAVSAMAAGAFDFIQKPFDLAQLEVRVERAVEHVRLRGELTELRSQVAGAPGDFVVANSPAMRSAVETAQRVAAVRSTVLLTGETGTGKEVIAGLIHAYSPNAAGPFVKVNCAALPETLLESALFGHERGAFTGADRQHIGHFEQASHGTLLLDEIAETSPATQAKLLRVLQEQEFYRLGGTTAQRTHARVIAATNRDMREALRDGSLREDLYYRINVIEIHLDPLRDRREDIEALAEHYRERFAHELGRPCMGFTEAALAHMVAYPWPGNVRELRNAIERSVLLGSGTQIDVPDVQLGGAGFPGAGEEWKIELPPNGLSLHTVERALVLAALRRTGFVQKDAAELMGVSKRKLNYMIARMGLVHESWRRNRDGVEPATTQDGDT